MKIWVTTTLAALVSTSPYVMASPFDSIPAATIDIEKVNTLITEIESSDENVMPVIMRYYAAVLPTLRYRALVKEDPLSVRLYSLVEDSSYEFIQFYLADKSAMEPSYQKFYEDFITSDSTETIRQVHVHIPLPEVVEGEF
ncbi:hypothetical protein [Vibrio chaetopteri]|uniref:Uncharacterized protein n=1 Tax=Vibrio chaetopteri TaxID=3016528 RepID=A0AAU8BSR4_9VIBR